MAVTPITPITQVITPLPTAPARTMPPATFVPTADAFVNALPTFGTQENTLASQMNVIATQTNANAQEAYNDAAAALVSANNSAASAAASASSSSAQAWVSGTTYTAGTVVYSLVTFQTYRRTTNGGGTTDPYADPTNWIALTQFSAFKTVSTTYTANANDRLRVNTTGGAFTITFPSAPVDATQIEIMDVANYFNYANCTLNANGKTIKGYTTMILNVPSMHLAFTYDAASGDWKL